MGAWLAAFEGDFAAFARWISVAENGGHDGPLPDGTASLESGVAVLRASFPFDSIRQGCHAGRRALELEADPDSPWGSLIRAALGYCLYWAGEPEESRRALEECLRFAGGSPTLPADVLIATSFLSLIEYEGGSLDRAEQLARRAIEHGAAHVFDATKLAGTAHVVLGMVLASRGRAQEAAERLERGIELVGDSAADRARLHALLAYASVRQTLGDRAGARAMFEEARLLIEEHQDPGLSLVSMLGQVGRKLRRTPRRIEPGRRLSEAEMEVLRLLARDLQRRQIADALYLSVNTIKSHVRSIYRKLGVSSQQEAVEAARRSGFIS